jgi:hypothetical protein
MSMTEWARNEIKLACKKENKDWDGESFDYGCSCYQSALKAYESLMEDGHSGYSFGLTKNILIRLMEGNPLSPITDDDFKLIEPYESIESLKQQGLKSRIQCPRMSSLFREESLDGVISYNDIGRYYCTEINNEKDTYTNGFISNIIDRMFPISMPYLPLNNKYKVYTDTFLYDKNNGDFDTRAILYVITPQGEKIYINIYQAEIDGKFVEITKDEFEQRKINKI